MFGKKKSNSVSAMHYEGIEQFATDYPVELEIKDDVFEIRRIKPETIVTLSLDRIYSFTAMEESKFMQQYKGNTKITSKSNINKYYLVVNYDKGKLVFWGTAKAYRFFIDLQYKPQINAPANIEL